VRARNSSGTLSYMTRRAAGGRALMRRLYEREYPWRVDVPVPPMGLGMLLDEMLSWCTSNASAKWATHGMSIRVAGEAPEHICRFYFFGREDAMSFSSTFSESGARLSNRDG
jgi:hypothetical protein